MARRAFGTGSIWKEKRSGYEVWVGQVRVDRKQRQKVLGRVRKSGAGASEPGVTRRQAERELQAFRVALEEKAATDLVEVPRDRARLAVVGEAYCEEASILEKVSIETVRDYRKMLGRHLVPFLGDVPLFEVSVDDVKAFRHHQLTQGNVRNGGGPLRGQTVRTHMQLLGAVFKYAMREGIVAVNPVSSVEMPKASPVEKDIRFLTIEEVEALVRAARNVPDTARGNTDATIILTAAMTGLRRSELVALRWRDIDWGASVVRVRRSRRRGRTKDPSQSDRSDPRR